MSVATSDPLVHLSVLARDLCIVSFVSLPARQTISRPLPEQHISVGLLQFHHGCVYLVECHLECLKVCSHSDYVPVERADLEFVVAEIIPHLVLVGLPLDLLLDRVNVYILPQAHYLRVEVPQVVHEL